MELMEFFTNGLVGRLFYDLYLITYSTLAFGHLTTSYSSNMTHFLRCLYNSILSTIYKKKDICTIMIEKL